MTFRRALDLFCGGGGAARGILAAGFDEVVGIDNKDHRKSYPGHFVRGDALNPPVRLEDFDFVWASPPCQRFTPALTTGDRSAHPDMIPQTRELLRGHRWTCMENVPQAPLRPDIVLVGGAVGLPRLLRRRHFETTFTALVPEAVRPGRDQVITVTTTRGCAKARSERRKAKGLAAQFTKTEMASAMGLPMSMTTKEIGESVPPAYAEFISREALRQMQ